MGVRIRLVAESFICPTTTHGKTQKKKLSDMPRVYLKPSALLTLCVMHLGFEAVDLYFWHSHLCTGEAEDTSRLSTSPGHKENSNITI